MLLSRGDEQEASTQYINEALKKGYLTIYLPINGSNNNSSSSSLSKIVLPGSIEYEENMNRGNLLTLDTRTFYNFALAGDLQPFEELKVLIEEAIEEKKIASERNGEEEPIVLVVAGVAAELNRNEKFDECINVEKWWQKTHSEWLQKGLKVTVICPHLIPKLDKTEFMHYKQTISSLHDIVVDSSGSEWL
jgi:gamma-glutamyl-gamma-aminobutyrate hydrolase PuuD